jgi:hypothetical protein
MGTMSSLYGLLRRTAGFECEAQVVAHDWRQAWRPKTWFLATLFSLTALLGYLFLVAPLQQQVLVEQVRGAARSIDSIVKSRSAAIATVGRSLDLGNLMSETGGNQALSALQDQFPDFLSLEVLNEDGALLAMFGDLSLTEAGRKGRSRDLSASDSARGSFKNLFQDYPQEDCFLITTKQTATDGSIWFTRARFSRDSIKKALAPFDANGTAELQAASTSVLEQATAGEPSQPQPVTVFSNWWSRETKAEAGLLTPGWVIIVKANSAGALLSRYLVIALGTLALLALGHMLVHLGSSANHAAVRFAAAKNAGWKPSALVQSPDETSQSGLEPKITDMQSQEAHTESESEVVDDSNTALGATLELESPVLEEDSETIPEFLEVAWVEPDVEEESQKHMKDEHPSPSVFVGP